MARPWHRVKFGTSTTGQGTLTITTAANGYRTPATAGVPNGEVVSYLIVDGALGWEVGQGVYSAGTLTRGLIESSTGSLLNCSVNAVVMLTPLVSDFAEGRVGGNHIYSPNTADPSFYLQPPFLRSVTQNFAALAVNFVVLNPIYLPKSQNFSSIALSVQTAASAGAVAQIGIYNCDQENMRPTTRLLSSGDLPLNTTGIKEYGFGSTAFKGGTWYYLACNCNSATGAVMLANTLLGSPYLNYSGVGLARAEAFVSGGLPTSTYVGTDFGHISAIGGTMPRIGIR